jgi:isocitrate/isopropylmalate dehydrogenase
MAHLLTLLLYSDIGGKATTSEMGDAICEALNDILNGKRGFE